MPKTATPRKPETVSRKLAETRNTSKNRSLSSLLGIGDNEKRLATDLGSGLNDVIGRGTIAGLLGLPGDLGGAAENGLRSLLGLPQVVPYGGSEHIGQKMEQAGLVSDVRRPKTELLASLISPAQAATAGYKAPQMARAGVKALDNLTSAPTMARMGQRGAIDPDLLKQLVSDASKYESANDYRKAYVAEHLMDLSNPQNHRIGRLIEDGVDEDTMRYMDAKYTADMYGRRGNNEYKYQREAMVPDVNTPDDMVTIYRGTDPAQKDMIPGDFVSFNRDYAAGHGDNVLSMRVPARDVVFQGNDFHEWIYSPERLRGDKYEGGLDKVWEMSRNGQPVGNLGKMVAPQDEALRVAQANALPDTDAGYAPLGSWVRDPFTVEGKTPIRQVREIPLDRLVLPELDTAGKILPHKAAYVERYAEAMRNGDVFPNLRGSELESGMIKIQDGHRRALAAKLAGKDSVLVNVDAIGDYWIPAK